jgi:hypothetical protein
MRQLRSEPCIHPSVAAKSTIECRHPFDWVKLNE